MKKPITNKLEIGWDLAMISFSVLLKNKVLFIFPILSTISLLFVLASFLGGVIAITNIHIPENIIEYIFEELMISANYMMLFAFYLVNYFVIIFFNMGLMHSALMVFNGNKPKVGRALLFCFSRIGSIFVWSILSATVGFIFRLIEDKSEYIGSIISGLLGMLWSVMTFFVVPIMAYEKLNLKAAIKRSSKLLKKTYGERLGAFSAFGILWILILIAVIIPIYVLYRNNHLSNDMFLYTVGIFVCIISVFMATADIIFKAAAYQFSVGGATGEFDKGNLDSIFIEQKNLKKGFKQED